MLLLLGFRFFYDDWGSMIAIFFTIASAFIEIDAAVRAKTPAAFLAQVYERMLDDQKLAHVLQRLNLLFARKIEDPVDFEGQFLVLFFQTIAADATDGG